MYPLELESLRIACATVRKKMRCGSKTIEMPEIVHIYAVGSCALTSRDVLSGVYA